MHALGSIYTSAMTMGSIRNAWLAGAMLLGACGGAPPPPDQTAAATIVIAPAPVTSEVVAMGAPEPAPRRDGMVRVEGGILHMGSDDGDFDERPVHDVAIEPFDIDATEVTMRAYDACVRAAHCTAASQEVWWPGMSDSDHETGSRNCNQGRQARSDHPVNCVDWEQARAYCQFAGKRLPTEPEWERAARGTDSRTYPWGNAPPSRSLLNGCGLECVEMFRDWGFTVKATYEGRDSWEGTSPVGLFKQGASPYGALDMAGNVWEWTASEYCQYPHTSCERGKIALRGGGWLNHEGASGVRAANRDSVWATMKGSALGFRCARSIG
ncbi:MAG: SUMF1/EgtB/PvdO family nonheme iron enzyme [Deltaproteobacteria bacterium]|nr:SUMF1/EgtB/PvdO family nonheme iron enzyme [Deltaproteobacteria bacterium]